MIWDADTYRRSTREVRRLEKLVENGTATERDHARYHAGVEELLCYEWGEEWRKHKPAPRPYESEPEAEPAPHPLALRFATWWERNRGTKEWKGEPWWVAFRWWWEPRRAMDGPDASRVLDDAARLLGERELGATAATCQWPRASRAA